LDEALGEQQMLATAAKAITEVPEFNLPSSEPIQAPAATTTPPPEATPARSTWRRTWIAWTAAAAVLIAVGALTASYHAKVDRLEQALATAKKDYRQTADQFASLPAKYADLQKSATERVQRAAEPYVHIVGPTTILAGGKAHLHIATRNADGTPTDADVRITLRDADTGNKVEVINVTCNKETIAELDARAAKADSVLNVIVEAESRGVKARVQESMRVLAPTFATRLDTNKIAYPLKDVLFFRVVVLDRFSLTPPSESIALRVDLLDPRGTAVRSLDMQTGAGGVAANEFAIDEKFTAGAYTLSVRAADAKHAQILPTSQRLDVVRELIIPDLVLDKDYYRPGDEISGVYRGMQPLPERVMIGPMSVPLTREPAFGGFGGGGGIPGGGGPGSAKKKGKSGAPVAPMITSGAQRFAAPIPATVPTESGRVPLTMKVPDGTKLRELRTEIPLAPTEFAVDFFPEGGDLIAGVENRLYYRVRSKSGEPISSDGKLILLCSKEVKDSAYHLGMGYVTFVPDPKETYTVRVTTPVKTETIANPFAALGIRLDGVVVHVPDAVGRQGDPIRLTLRQQGPPRKLLLVANCRGQIVDQRWVEIKGKQLDTELLPTPGAAGLIRVTAYEQADIAAPKDDAAPIKTLVPVAERLVYRTAAQHLQLGFKLNTHQLFSGQQLHATVTARDEKGQAAPAWLLASVVDERFQATPRSLSDHFFIFNEIKSGADLDHAMLVLHNGPDSTAVLERFLGTHGWRRFIRTPEPGAPIDPAKRPQQPLVFSRENRPLEAIQGGLELATDIEMKRVRLAAFSEQMEMEDQVTRLSDEVKSAASNLYAFKESVQLWTRLLLGVAMAVLLIVALVMMAVGVYRIARTERRATWSFGSAFGCLLACMGILVFGAWLGAPQVFVIETPDAVAAARKVGLQLDEKLAQHQPGRAAPTPRQATGVFFQALAAADNQLTQMASGKTAGDHAVSDAAIDDALARIARRDRGGDAPAPDGRPNALVRGGADRSALEERFDKARNIGRVDQQKDKKDASPPPAAKGNGGPNPQPPGGSPTPWSFEYAAAPKSAADTLLWHPTLWLPNGSADVRFDMGSGQATYRVLLLGHGPTGRLGFFETRLDVP
jgi:hypothetical protein